MREQAIDVDRQQRLVRISLRILAFLLVAAGTAAGCAERNVLVSGIATWLGVAIPFGCAIGFCLIGIALGLATSAVSFAAQIARVVAGTALGLGLLSLAPRIVDFDVGILELGGIANMAPLAAIAFALLGAAILLGSRKASLSQLLSLVAATIGVLPVLEHLFGVSMLDQPLVGQLTVPSAMLLIGAASGVLFLHPESGLPSALMESSEAGRQLRRVASAATLPIVLGWLLTAGEQAGWYHRSFQMALFGIAFMLALLGLSYWSYTSLRRSDRERRRARAELAASEARYRRTFEHARIGIARVAPDGRWLQVNERLVEILGYEASELLEKTYADVSYLEDLEIDVKQWELLRRGEISDYGVERRFETKNGEIVHADVRIAREEDGAGELRHLIVVLQDITARKISEGTRRVYERALAATQSGVVITDARQADHPIAYANAAFLKMTGYAPAEVIGKNCRILNEKAREQVGLDEVRRAISTGETCSVLLRNHRKNGEAFWNQLSVAPIEDSSGRLTHFVGVMIDATERMQVLAEREELLAAAQSAREGAESANRAKDRFLSMVSHELRSPLNAILAWTSLLRDEPGEDVARVVKAIEASVQSQSRLVNELLDASRIREGTLQIEPARIDLEPVVKNAVNRLAPIASEKGLSLEIAAQGPAFVSADAERIEQVVRNLVDNALKFTPQGGHVHVTLSEGDGCWRIEVRDNGRGIAADALPHVFDEFWQAERKGSSRSTGLGLGLMIVKHLVELHGGSVGVESEGTDRGTTVGIELPKVSGPLPTDPALETPDLSGVEAVVVDDDAATVQAIALALGRVGAICHSATSVSEALRFIERRAPDVLVSDIGLPDRDGLDLIRSVRALGEPTRSILAIAVTGLVEPEDRRRIRRAGFDSYIAKPLEPDVVIDRIIRLRALQSAVDAPVRRILILDPNPEAATELAVQLRKQGHEVREARGPAEALREANYFQPQIVLARASADLDASVLGERLLAQGVRADLVGFGDDDPDLGQKGFNRILASPLDPKLLDRFLRFTEAT